MDLAARLAAFKRIKEHFDGLDRDGLRHGKLPMHTTGFGFWGTTNMNDAYTFFSRIRLERFKGFVDLGCGDGRIVMIASLFTDAVGIEGDKDLVEKGKKAMEELGLWNDLLPVLKDEVSPGEKVAQKRIVRGRGIVSENGNAGQEGVDGPDDTSDPDGIHTAELKNKNYYDEDFSGYEIIFMFPDNRYDARMVGKLLTEFKGYLFVYNRIHSPPGIKAGKTYWIDQMPIASYPINVEDENLEMR